MDRRKKTAFSLAELMITLLILSIVLSAVMPAVTKRNAGHEGVWRWLYDGSHAYFGTGSKQEALIGMAVKPKFGEATIPDYKPLDINGSDAADFTMTDSGDRLLIMKYTYQTKEGSNVNTWHPMSNSHITFFSSSFNSSGTNEQVHYAGRLALDETNIALGKFTMAKVLSIDSSDHEKAKRNNLAIGQYALYGLATGYENVALGNGALYSNGIGHRNVALGYQALLQNESGHENSALGYQSLFNTSSGYENIAVGHQAGFGIAKGYYNTAVGSFSLKAGPESVNAADMSGYANTALGFGALHKGANSQYNTTLGFLSGNQTTGINNLFAGAQSGFNNTSGSGNVILGFLSGYYNNMGDNNIFIGHRSGFSNTNANNNVFMGYQSGYSNTVGQDGVFLGSETGYSNTNAYNNVFIGYKTGYSNTTGQDGVFLGSSAGYSNTTAGHNVFIGHHTGYSNTQGADNTFIGYQAGYSNTAGGNNVFIGYKAGFSNTDSSNQFVLSNGYDLLKGQFPASDTDESSTFEILAKTTNIGKNNANQPTIVVNSTDGTIAFGGKLTTAGGGTNPLDIVTDVVMNGKNISGVGTLHAQTVNATNYIGLPAMPSDKRLKNVTGEAKKGLSTVDAMKIVKFNYKNDETKTEHVGVIAQELQKILPSAVLKTPDGFLAVSLNDVMFTIAKAVQELHQAVLDLTKEVKALVTKVTSNTQKIEALEKENAALKKQISDLDARLKKLEEAK